MDDDIEGLLLSKGSIGLAHLANGAYEYLLPKRIRSVEDLEEIVEDIRVQDEIDNDNEIVIDFYKLLRIERIEENPKKEPKVEVDESKRKTEIDE